MSLNVLVCRKGGKDWRLYQQVFPPQLSKLGLSASKIIRNQQTLSLSATAREEEEDMTWGCNSFTGPKWGRQVESCRSYIVHCWEVWISCGHGSTFWLTKRLSSSPLGLTGDWPQFILRHIWLRSPTTFKTVLTFYHIYRKRLVTFWTRTAVQSVKFFLWNRWSKGPNKNICSNHRKTGGKPLCDKWSQVL